MKLQTQISLSWFYYTGSVTSKSIKKKVKALKISFFLGRERNTVTLNRVVNVDTRITLTYIWTLSYN